MNIPDLTGKIILVAEDDERQMQLLEIYLGRTNCTILKATNGREAIKQYYTNKNTIDMIITDHDMMTKDDKKDYSGYDVAKAAKRVKINRSIPIIIRTSYTMKDLFKTYGFHVQVFDDHINKNANKEQFYKTISKYFN